ncbi:hypothetical protein [Rhodocyclus tenuis]|uniref:hypothetical protein n=1 Tax=Rhodocyclus tenuis TaxID=1066 RepID=UPI0019084DE4|nr:hypothetical protein [Rhodocyclus tenuis]MBK1680661.1 hypothetical protein [Rhodocyclus tenuis]
MQGIAAIALLGISALLGAYLGWQYLRRVRSRPALTGFHLVFAAAGLEAMVMLRGELPAQVFAQVAAPANAAGLLLVLAVLTGLAIPMIAKGRPRIAGSTALAVHALVGMLGFVLLLIWALRL